MMSHTTFQIIYDGPALENSTMDVKDLAPALLALGEANNENVISENELTMVLMIESPSFKKANKWKFNTGGNSFFASINDLVFLDKVDSGEELFGKGDYLTAIVAAKQLMTDSGLKMEYAILKVIRHDRKPDQTLIF